jgi:hypothetical protein
MLASSKGHTAVVQVLIAAGANLELLNKVSDLVCVRTAAVEVFAYLS